jgi:hypothetical protein
MEGHQVDISQQVDALEQRAEELKNSFEEARHETSEQVRARLERAKSASAAQQQAARAEPEQSAGRAQAQWKKMRADVSTKMQYIQARLDRKRD